MIRPTPRFTLFPYTNLFFFNDTATTEIYSLSLHDALPIYAGTVTLTIPASTAGGVYYLFSKADADDVVLENHETNNLYATNITIGADLVISAMSLPTDASADVAITVSDTTKKQGSGCAGASTTTYYLSADGALYPSDVVLGSRAVGALA